MKTLLVAALVTVLTLAVGVPVHAFSCPGLIRQANEQITKMDQNSERVKQAKALVEEADKLHKAGNHADSEKKAQEALALLK